ncbi:hypothetical protein [Phytoactinopolyspora endophytica]|uniref:hypothetical protein n=1 Tax=Phytoactinopolyspora endophytica TaxID=1642495 RepID=UPI00101DA1ED|nr:hypothetical protein [Phytoactinopolyspora endophytica]
MSDDGGYIVLPNGERVSEAELVQEVRQALLDPVQHDRSPPVDEHGDPLPRLNVDDPSPETDDPVLRVGYALLADLPLNWETAFLDVTAAADEVRTSAMVKVRGADAASHAFRFYFPEIAEACLALRRATYEPNGRGAWYNAIIRLDRDGTISLNYDFTNPPFGCWSPNEADLVLRDQVLYPRDPELLPPWHPARQ